MAYTKTEWNNGEAPYLNEDNLNKIEQGIYNNSIVLDNLAGVIHNSGSATGGSATLSNRELARITLPETGIYLILIAVNSDSSLTDQIITATINNISTTNITTISGFSNFRGIMNSGGGLAGWKIIETTSASRIIAVSGQATSSFTLTGHICAIKIG